MVALARDETDSGQGPFFITSDPQSEHLTIRRVEAGTGSRFPNLCPNADSNEPPLLAIPCRPYAGMNVLSPEPVDVARFGGTPNEHMPSRLGVRGFLPLPPILASPLETPSVSATTSAEEGVSVHVVLGPPTWISTPPTPPTKLTRHSSASFPQRSGPSSPLASFSASMQTHARARQAPRLNKCISVPTMFGRIRTISEPLLGGSSSLPMGPTPPFHDRTMDQNYGRCGPRDADIEKLAGSPPRSKAIFHISNPPTDDDDDNVFHSAESRPRSVNSDTNSWNDQCPEDVWGREKSKDSRRKFHALKELLSTEIGYLADLKVFVTVYLRNLPTLTTRAPTYSTFGRASASFTSGPRTSSSAQIHATSVTPSAPTDGAAAPLSAPSGVKDISKPNSRYLFTDTELELVARNAEDILKLHERFVSELQETLEDLGYTMDADIDELATPDHLENLESAIRAVSAKFATEASRFNAYQTFCAGHPEALDIVRRVSQQHPVEWDGFEQRCSAIIANGDIDDGLKITESEALKHIVQEGSVPHAVPFAEDRTRALSLTSLDTAVRTLRLRYPCSARDVAPLPDIRRESHRNVFADYLIKPVQRICKYPLLFDQVLSSKPLRAISPDDTSARPHVDVIVKSAAQAMRHVASSVDEARHRQDAAIQTSLITSRMFFGMQALGSLADSTVQGLSAEFVSSLGPCVLAGSLDVMHHHPLQPLDSTLNFKAKYLGAFLYMGGYLILVKVLKGRRYEPRHWFNLSHFTISGVEDEALLPDSIRVSCFEEHFELAASCQREKDVWLAAIHSSLRDKPSWTNEPTPSFKLDEKGALISSLHSEAELLGGLPTILSIPELPNNNSDPELSEPFFPYLRGPTRKRNKLRRPDGPGARSDTAPPTTSRRSSTTSVKAMFVPLSDAESIVIRRCSPVARQQVDQALQDVISQSCITARSYAYSRDAELFRSGSTALSRTKSRLSKHESIRVPRSRTSDNLDSMLGRSSSQHPNQATQRNRKKLSISSAPPVIDERKFLSGSPTSLEGFESTSPENSRQTSAVPSLTSSNASSTSTSSATLLPMTPITPTQHSTRHKQSRSLLGGVKELFTLRPGHHHHHSLSHPAEHPAHEVSAPPAATRALSRLTGTIRRRPRTAPSRLDNSLVITPLPKYTTA